MAFAWKQVRRGIAGCELKLTIRCANANAEIRLVNDPVNDPANDGLRLTLDAIATHPGIRRNAIAKLLGVSVATVKRRVKLLGKRIEFRGAPKNSGYYVISDEK